MGTTATSQSYTGKTGTIPTEFGIMTDVTSFSLYSNTFASLPTQIGLALVLLDLTGVEPPCNRGVVRVADPSVAARPPCPRASRRRLPKPVRQPRPVRQPGPVRQPVT